MFPPASKSILVTGANGFLGRRLIDALMDGGHTSVWAHDRENIVFRPSGEGFWPVHGDLCELGTARLCEFFRTQTEPPIHAIVHLAAVASPRLAENTPQEAWRTNVEGTHAVVKLAAALGVKRLVFLSSAHVYGISPKYRPTDETHPLAALDTYTTTKIMGERLCELFWEYSGVSSCILRLFNSYGPGQNPDYLIGAKINQARLAATAGVGVGTFPLAGGATTKDWVYVNDVVRAILMAIDSDYVGAVNVGTGVETDLATIAARIADHYNVGIAHLPKDDIGPTNMCADIRRIKNTLGWEPLVPLEYGMQLTLEAADREAATP